MTDAEWAERREWLAARRRRRARIAGEQFWRDFRKRWGLPPSEAPERYWSPELGHFCSLRPSDLADLTPRQLDACRDLIESAARR